MIITAAAFYCDAMSIIVIVNSSDQFSSMLSFFHASMVHTALLIALLDNFWHAGKLKLTQWPALACLVLHIRTPTLHYSIVP